MSDKDNRHLFRCLLTIAATVFTAYTIGALSKLLVISLRLNSLQGWMVGITLAGLPINTAITANTPILYGFR